MARAGGSSRAKRAQLGPRRAAARRETGEPILVYGALVDRVLYYGRGMAIGELSEGGGLDVWRSGFRFTFKAFSHATSLEARRALWAALGIDADGPDVTTFSGSPLPVTKVSTIFTRVGDDDQVFTYHVLKPSEGGATELDGTELGAIATAMIDWWTAVNGDLPEVAQFCNGETALDRVDFHRSGPDVVGTDGRLISPPNPSRGASIFMPSFAGTGDLNDLPPQCASAVTLKTSIRRQWGRFYAPCPTTQGLDSDSADADGAGRLHPDYQGALRTATGRLLETLSDAGTPMVVFSSVHAHALSVDQVQVDDVWDVIRRRRFKHTRSRLTHTLGA